MAMILGPAKTGILRFGDTYCVDEMSDYFCARPAGTIYVLEGVIGRVRLALA
jgi:hypothetical protein